MAEVTTRRVARWRHVTAAATALRSPSDGLIARGVRFGFAGGVVAVVYLTATTVLADVVGLPFQLALLIGTVLSVCVHFTLQRLFVWTHDEQYALSFHHQVAGYMAVVAVQYAIVALTTWRVPSLLGVPTELVYLVTVIVISCVNFLIFRHFLFHARSTGDPADQPPGPGA